MPSELLLQEEESSGNRLKWTAIGAVGGAPTGYLLSGPLGPYAESPWRRNWTLDDAASGAILGLILSAPEDADRSEFGVGSVSTFIPPSRDSASQQAVALGVGTFIGFAGADVAFLHLLGSYERRLSSNVELVAEGGLIMDEDNLFAAIAPALKLGLTSENSPSLFARAGPALLGTTSGVEVLVHVGTGIDLAAPATGLRFEARTYVSPSHVSLDVLEVILSYRFDSGERHSVASRRSHRSSVAIQPGQSPGTRWTRSTFLFPRN